MKTATAYIRNIAEWTCPHCGFECEDDADQTEFATECEQCENSTLVTIKE